MFYSDLLLNSDKDLARVWLAAHWTSARQIKKSAIISTDLEKTTRSIIQYRQDLALRIASKLLFGLSRIHLRKVEYLYFDSESAINLLRPTSQLNHKRPNTARTSTTFAKKKNQSNSETTNPPKRSRKIISELTWKELSTTLNGANSDEIIMRSSQQKVGRKEDISLPDDDLLEGNKNQYIEEEIRASQQDHLVPLKIRNDSNDKSLMTDDSAVELPRFAEYETEERLSDPFNAQADLDEDLEGMMFDENLEEIREGNGNSARLYKSHQRPFVLLDNPVKLSIDLKSKNNLQSQWNSSFEDLKSEILRNINLPLRKLLNPPKKRHQEESESSQINPKRHKNDSIDEETFPNDDEEEIAQIDFDSQNESVTISTDTKTDETKELSKGLEEKLSKLGGSKIDFWEIAKNTSRKTTAKIFYEILCLKSRGVIHCNQEEMLGTVSINHQSYRQKPIQ